MTNKKMTTKVSKSELSEHCTVCKHACSTHLFEASSWETFAQDKVYSIQQCNNCASTYTIPELSEHELSEFYEKGLYGGKTNRFNSFVKIVSNIFQAERLRKVSCDQKSGSLLDIGCGKGKFMSYAADKRWRVSGIEPAETGSTIAERQVGIPIFRSLDDLENDEPFDVVTMWHVVEHLLEPTEELQRIKPFLKQDGRIFIAIPNFESIQSKLGKSKWSHLDVPRHRVHYTPQSISNLLNSVGYDVQYIDHFSFEFNPLGALQTALNLLGCQPGIIYNLLKRNFSYNNTTSRQFFYSLFVICIGIPLLAIPALIFSYCESLLGRGGTMLVCAKKSS